MEDLNNAQCIGECRQALESCSHHRGTVSVMCHLCLGQGVLQDAWDISMGEALCIDCPRCQELHDNEVSEVCPCLEPFAKETILQVIAGHEESYPELAEAVSWMRLGKCPRDMGTPVTGQEASTILEKIREWADEHKQITIPHPKAALILHLIAKGLIQLETLPGSRLVLRARAAKQEFCRFLAEQNRVYRQDDATINELLCFAYGVGYWLFDAKQLLEYQRGSNYLEIDSGDYDVIAASGFLRGDEEDIAEILRNAFGC